MDITWLGHSCFRVRTKDAVVVMDPFNKIRGLDLGRPKADIVTVSHDHPGHNNVAGVKGNPDLKTVTGPGEYEMHGIFITGIRTYHDDKKGQELGHNTIYILESEGMVFAHLGDLGHILSSEQTDLMTSVDILFLPVGGSRSLNAQQAAEVVTQIEPSIVIPMHFATQGAEGGLDGVERFCKEVGVSEVKPEERVTVKKSELDESMHVKILQPRSA